MTQFCGFLAQVKAFTLVDGSEELPLRVIGRVATQQEQMIAGIFHGLYLVGFATKNKLVRIDYIPAHVLQASPRAFEPRKPLKTTAKRAGWTGFTYNLAELPSIGIQRVYPAAST
jgi:hypothetical protein